MRGTNICSNALGYQKKNYHNNPVKNYHNNQYLFFKK